MEEERKMLERAKRDYNDAVHQALAKDIPRRDMDLVGMEDVFSVTSSELLEENRAGVQCAPTTKINAWRWKTVNRSPPQSPYDAEREFPRSAREERLNAGIEPWGARVRRARDRLKGYQHDLVETSGIIKQMTVAKRAGTETGRYGRRVMLAPLLAHP